MSDQLIEGVLRALNKNHEKLLEHLRTAKALEKATEGVDGHSSVLRKKSSADDELSTLDVLSISNVKRKSVYSRKVRPQSSLELSINSTSSECTLSQTVDSPVPDDGQHVFPNGQSQDNHSLLGSPKMEPRVAKTGHQSTEPQAAESIPEGKEEGSGHSSPVPAPRKRKSALLKTSMSCETTPGTPPLPIVHEKTAIPRVDPTVSPPTGQTGGMCSPDTESIMHDLDMLSRKHAKQREYISQESIPGYSAHVPYGSEIVRLPSTGESDSVHVDRASRPVDGKLRCPPEMSRSRSPVEVLSDYISSSPKRESEVLQRKSSPASPDKADPTADVIKGIKIHKKLSRSDFDTFDGGKSEHTQAEKSGPVAPPRPRPPLPSKNHKNVDAMKEEVRSGRLSGLIDSPDSGNSSECAGSRSPNRPISLEKVPEGRATTPAGNVEDSKGGLRWGALKKALQLSRPVHEKREAPLPPPKKVDDDEGEDALEEIEEAPSEGTDSTDLTEPSSVATSPLSSKESTPSQGSPVHKAESTNRSSPVHKAESTNRSSPVHKADSAGRSTPVHKAESSKNRSSPAHKVQKSRSHDKASPIADLSVTVDTSAPKLEHLAKARPKPPRTRAVTRPAVRTDGLEQSSLDPAQEDISDFFDTKSVSKEVIKSPTDSKRLGSPSTEKDDSKQEKKDKKGWSPFSSKQDGKGLGSLFSGKKSHSTKNPDATSKKLTSPQKLPGVKEGTVSTEPAPSTKPARSHSPDNEVDRKSGDDLEDEPEPEPVKRRVPGGMSMMGGNALMAEMQAKRLTMQGMGPKTKPADTLASSSTPTVSAVKMPPGGRPLFPPGGAPQPAKGSEEKPKPAPLRPRPPLVPPKPSRNSVSPNAPRKSNVNIATSSTSAPASSAPANSISSSLTPSTSASTKTTQSSTTPSNSTPTNTAGPVSRTATNISDVGNKGGTPTGSHKPALTRGFSGDGISLGKTVSESSARNSRNSTDSQSGGRKSPGAEPKSNGSTQGGDTKEEFLMYL